MYTKSPSKLTNKIHILTRYIEGTDIMNSLLLQELPNLSSSGNLKVTATRFDLLAIRAYGEGYANYDWVLRFFSGLNEEDLRLGMEIPYPSLSDVEKLVLSLDSYNE